MQEQLPPPAGSLPDEEDYRRFYHLESYLFRTVHDRFAKEKSLSAFDFFCIVIWKANRAKSKVARRMLRNGENLEQVVRLLTRSIAEQDSDKERLRYLMSPKWGFRLPMATAILTVLYPDRFTVYDVRVCDALGKFHNLSYTTGDRLWERYEQFRQAVIDSTPPELSLRDKDRQLWGRSFAKQLERDIACKFAGASEETEMDET
jgi:hypothetical protein